MKIKDILSENKLTFSFEFFPPKTEAGEDQLLETVKRLSVYEPKYISVTYGAGGGTREGTKRVVGRIIKETGITTMPHLTCIGSSESEILDILDGYSSLGVENILALRGDPPKENPNITLEGSELRYASDLVRMIKPLKRFSTGIAVYPEGHVQAASLEEDMKFTRIKADSGADFGITQLFFDNRYLYDFMERLGRAGVNIPIIAGIMPIAQFEKIKHFAGMCKATIPKALEDKMAAAGASEEAMTRSGMEYVTGQVSDLIKNGFKFFHIYTLNRADLAITLLENLGIKPRSS